MYLSRPDVILIVPNIFNNILIYGYYSSRIIPLTHDDVSIRRIQEDIKIDIFKEFDSLEQTFQPIVT
jgi:hypothetical protein